MSSLNIFIITISQRSSFTISDNNFIPLLTHVFEEDQKADMLPTLFDEGMKKLGFSPKNISRIFICNGPGSFTGIRAGIAFAFGLSCLQEISLFQINSFDAALLGAGAENKKELKTGIFIPFKANEFYTRIIQNEATLFEGTMNEKEVENISQEMESMIFLETAKINEKAKNYKCSLIVQTINSETLLKILQKAKANKPTSTNEEIIKSLFPEQPNETNTITPYYLMPPSISTAKQKLK